MLRDEEKKAIESLIEIREFANLSSYKDTKISQLNAIDVVLNLIEKQSKEIEELSDKLTEKICKGVEEEILEEYRQTIISKDKEIEELKDKNKFYNTAYNLGKTYSNKKWKDKIRAKIEPKLKELDEQINEEWKKYGNSKELQDMEDMYNFLQSLLEKELPTTITKEELEKRWKE